MSLPGHSAERMRRFYTTADVAPADGGGFAVRLDGRQPRSPTGQALVLPTEALAQLVAAEWAAQGENILPETMPATKLAWGALTFADGPASLVERQERRWGAVIDWAARELGASFHRTQGVIHEPQPPATIARIEALAGAESNFALAGLAAAASLFGSAILGFALRRGELTPEAAFELSRLDETFQEERWGVDAEAAARADAMAAEAVMLGAWFAAL
ncbi:MAG TPA: ATP12 family protein [Caulobacteraceae bacterium]|nr:ATP12 family protein [Caulobacteraceae bacterium]